MKSPAKFLALALILACSVSSAYAGEFMAVVTAPYAPLYAPDGTRDDDAVYGMVMNAAKSGDAVLVEMSYGVDPIDPENVQLVPASEAEAWRDSVTHQVIAPFADIQAEAKTSSFPAIITLPRGAYIKIGEVNSDDERYVAAELFGGVKGWVRKPLVRPIRKWMTEGEEQTRKNLVDDALRYLGTSYRWGGRTPEGVDCSGFVHMVYNLNGLEVYRNSPPQTGFPIALKHVPGNSDDLHTLETLKSLKPGDTIHFSGHVGMYLGDGKFIHANGKDFSTTIASLISGDEGFREDIARPSAINTFGTAFPDEPEKLSVKEFYAVPFESEDRTGYRFYVRAEGYAPNRAVLYPEGEDGTAIEISEDIALWRFVYSGRDSDKAPAYFYTREGEYTPAVELINDKGYRPSGKTIRSGIRKMKKPIKATVDPEDSSGFVLLSDAVPDAILEIRYYSTYNFVGDRIDGYEEPIAMLTKEAAKALREVSDELVSRGYRLKIYDAYRPQMAVNHFERWAHDLKDTRMKKYFYPELDKSVLFEQDYIMSKSGHSRGSTVDLTLFDMNTEKEVDMGGTFDYFGELSHPDYKKITEEQYNNRMLLREVMIKHGFKPLYSEWWHFTLRDEPYPDTYFTFPLKAR
ncbi:MAG: C40 family peptidase [Synergistaceae bacterium]|nr:C40 family peptidase [Synergistaceae bacterium]